VIFGPYPNPLQNPMIMASGYTPLFGEHTRTSELCGTCHTLFTPYADSMGTVLGEAPEQTPYLEWLNSEFPEDEIECQTCHMPQIDNPVTISNRPPFLGDRTPFAKHHFVGGNDYLLKILRQFGDELGTTSSEAFFDSTLARTYQNLNEAAEISLESQWSSDSALQIVITVQNNTGHKFPTAYPSRRAWLQVLVETESDTLFHSGSWSSETGQIDGLDWPYEGHHSIIESQDQVQIYENVPVDVYGQVTFTLLMISDYIKDNRLPPRGFSTTGPHYEHTAISGNAWEDINFNRDDADLEGTGADIVVYRIDGLSPESQYTLRARLLYQSITPEFVADLAEHDTPEVAEFLNFYYQVPNTPVVIDSVLVQSDPFEPCLPGDNNGDQVLDVLDVVLLVNCVLGAAGCGCGDLNSDQTLDILDIVILVSLILEE